jgi:IMP dehydrogenase
MIEKAYGFDDVLVKPRYSSLGSRDEVDISIKLSDKLTLDFPLMASPMVGVVDGRFAKKLSRLGGLAILHRFYKDEHLQEDEILQNNLQEEKYGISVRIGDESFYRFLDYNPSILLVDTANGYTQRLLTYCIKISDYIINNHYDTLLMAGNVATSEGIYNLRDAGCHLVRVGIGGGSPCSTRNKTGIGIPNISALMDYKRNVYKQVYPKIVIDGGIKNSGDFVKAIVAGADLGLAGKLYAECYESPNEGILYGMASRTHMENTKMNIKSVEGFDTIIKKKHSLEQFVREFGYGIKSAGTYLNARNLLEIHANGEFVEVSGHSIKKDIEKYD